MLLLAPVLTYTLVALAIFTIQKIRPAFKYFWLIIFSGYSIALTSIAAWHSNLPGFFKQQNIINVSNNGLIIYADGFSWVYALSIAGLSLAAVMTSLVRGKFDPAPWARNSALAALGILAILAKNHLILFAVWTGIDLLELVTALPNTPGEKLRAVFVRIGARVFATYLVWWAFQYNGQPLNIGSGSPSGIELILLALTVRIATLSLPSLYKVTSVTGRDNRIVSRGIAVAASLILLCRIPEIVTRSHWLDVLLLLTSLSALNAGYKWLRASDEMSGHSYWILGITAMSLAAALQGNIPGSVAWGCGLILSGLFLYSARHRAIIWIPLFGIWGLTTLPFSMTSSFWRSSPIHYWPFWIPLLIAQAMLLAGIVRHTLHSGETSIESHQQWTQIIYIFGLFILPALQVILGLWGWEGANSNGVWWLSALAIMLAIALYWSSSRAHKPIFLLKGVANRFSILPQGNSFLSIRPVFKLLENISNGITDNLEGENGILWSLLILALLITLAR
jgi:hypothetical protein